MPPDGTSQRSMLTKVRYCLQVSLAPLYKKNIDRTGAWSRAFVEVMKVIRQGRVSERTVEQILAVPQIQDRAVGIFKVTLSPSQVSRFSFFKMVSSSHRCVVEFNKFA